MLDPRCQTRRWLVLITILAVNQPNLLAGAPLSVWNQAYQQTYEADRLSSILAAAQESYVLLDPFGAGARDDWAAVVATLQANGNELAAYISIGTGEDWRSDFSRLQPSLVRKQWEAWGGEYFVDQPDSNVMAVMKARIDMIASYGFDWVEFDNMDWAYDRQNRAEYGFAVTIPESVAYYQALCEHAHMLGVKCMAKSTVENATIFDGVTYESFPDDMGWWDQSAAAAFLNAGKPVIIVHYDEADCDAALAAYVRQFGPDVSFLCESQSAKGYLRIDRKP